MKRKAGVDPVTVAKFVHERDSQAVVADGRCRGRNAPGDTRRAPMTVGQLSAHTGVPVKALRRYTDWGLVHTLGRSTANYRLFPTDAVYCLEQIAMLRNLGLTLAGTISRRSLPIRYLARISAIWSDASSRVSRFFGVAERDAGGGCGGESFGTCGGA